MLLEIATNIACHLGKRKTIVSERFERPGPSGGGRRLQMPVPSQARRAKRARRVTRMMPRKPNRLTR
jgi:hypothetical protein